MERSKSYIAHKRKGEGGEGEREGEREEGGRDGGREGGRRERGRRKGREGGDVRAVRYKTSTVSGIGQLKFFIGPL